MGATIGRVHHVGHVVPDITATARRYRSMGFAVPPPSFPVLAGEGAPRVLGAGNAHVSLRRGFVELVTVPADGRLPEGAELVPLEVPTAALDRVAASAAATTARLAAALGRGAGLHILVLQAADADAVAARLSAAGVGHGGVLRLTRPSSAGPVPIALVEIDEAAGPEGRLAVAEDLPESPVEHPNGALDLLGPTLCVPDAELDAHVARYERLLGRPARTAGPSRVLDLDPGRVEIVPASRLAAVLPGARPPGRPAFVAVSVRVRDLAATRALLDGSGLPVRTTGSGAVCVPVDGTTVVFC
jgi:hypothetical protein